jgi:hypothetical protein
LKGLQFFFIADFCVLNRLPQDLDGFIHDSLVNWETYPLYRVAIGLRQINPKTCPLREDLGLAVFIQRLLSAVAFQPKRG